MAYWLVGIAGVLGTWLRYVLGQWVQQAVPQGGFPAGTLAVNLAGCFALGWFSRWALDNPRIFPRFRTAVSTGFIGSFTTFSTFSVETVQLFRQEQWGIGILYAGLSMAGGLCLTWLGTAVAGRRKERVEHV